ncbi:uncharacterized protein FA14DRAFT_30167 [Meira miltonrushii]|uniref:Uncharacterized protein n=1 Tax=Meira miltonrushii TaxID=1280837 RepID=A0A316V116_9BASI|nr:uncharacterized protein FA14DRAFT_30167 [Meira miltonrushii]PWN31240.1 hypothetical protein FA14DRAFT_30167 [Meira miltonrushii]
MGFKDHIRVGRHPSPDLLPSPPVTPHDFKAMPAGTDKRGRSAHKDDSALHTQSSANDPDLTGKQPKRSSSFGRSLGGLQSLANGMSRAGESLSRKSTNVEGVNTPNTHAAPTNVMGPPSMPDSSHLAQYSLKLSELVNKAFFPCTAAGASSSPNSSGLGATSSLAGAAKNAAAKTTGTSAFSVPALTSIIYDGKRLPSKAVINEIAMTVVAELEYASSVDPYLLRAVSRQSLKALTMFADRIDSLIVTPSKDSSVLYIPSTAKESVHLPAALEFNLGLISLEWIVEDALERCIEGPPGSIEDGLPHFVSEILTPVRKKMETTILHVVQPLLVNAKASLYSTINKSVLAPFAGFGQNLTPISSANAAAMTPGLMSPGTGPTSPPVAPANSAWLKELEGKVEATRRLLIPRLADRCGQDGEGWFISVAIHTIWKGLLILTSKSLPVPSALLSKFSNGLIAHPIQAFAAEVNKRAPSPAQLTSALKSVSVVGRARKGADTMGTPSGTSTPSNPHLANNTPGATLSVGARAITAHISDLQAFEKLMLRLAAGFGVRKDGIKSGSSPNEYGDDSSDSESDDDDEDELARAALAEALQAIRSTILVAQYLDVQPEAILDATKRTRGRSSQNSNGQISSTLPSEVVHAAKAIPSLLLLQLVYARMPTHLGVFALQAREDGPAEAIVPTPPAAFGYSWTDYERAIAGFAGGQTWSKALGEAWRQDVQEAQVDIQERKEEIEKQFATKSRPIQLSPESLPTVDGTTEATPTPESVLMQRSNASPAMSAGGGSSNDSLPEMMTKSAPDLKSGEAGAASLKPVRSLKDYSPKLGSNAQLQFTQKDRPTWSFIRSASRKVRSVSGSENSSPQKTPDASPPHTPALNATRPVGDVASMDMNGGKVATPQTTSSRKFWRTPSSQGGQSNGAGTGGGFHLPTLNSVRSAVSSRDVHPQIDQNFNAANTMSESERAQEEIRLESECVRLLTRALDAVQIPSRSNSTSVGVSTADANKEVATANAAH